MICPYCGAVQIHATSPTTGCCEGERVASGHKLDPYRLTKREHLAAMAMQGMVAHAGWCHEQAIAQFSVAQADALLAELAKGRNA